MCYYGNQSSLLSKIKYIHSLIHLLSTCQKFSKPSDGSIHMSILSSLSIPSRSLTKVDVLLWTAICSTLVFKYIEWRVFFIKKKPSGVTAKIITYLCLELLGLMMGHLMAFVHLLCLVWLILIFTNLDFVCFACLHNFFLPFRSDGKYNSEPSWYLTAKHTAWHHVQLALEESLIWSRNPQDLNIFWKINAIWIKSDSDLLEHPIKQLHLPLGVLRDKELAEDNTDQFTF